MSMNPYESPSVSSIDPGMAQFGVPRSQVWVDGKSLVVRPGVVLPNRCVMTNGPVAASDMITKSFTWCPRWVIVVFILSRLLGLIAYFIFRHTLKVTYGVAPNVRRKRRKRMTISILVGIGFLAGIPIAAGSMDDPSIPLVICIVGAIAALFSLIYVSQQLSVRKHKDGSYWIAGCCDEFLASIRNSAA